MKNSLRFRASNLGFSLIKQIKNNNYMGELRMGWRKVYVLNEQ